ncbi:MAG: hypothetical protein WD049_09265 [Candidatus Paceibacterota bacterium]
MALFCYVTERLKKDAGTHGIAQDRVESFHKEIESKQSLAGFDHFPPPCLTKKKVFGFNFRLIAAEKRVGDHLVVVLLRLVIRGGNEYSDFLRDPPTWAGRFYDAELSSEKLAEWVTDRTRVDPPEPPSDLSEAERTFLWLRGSGHDADDAIVCETTDWVDSVQDPRINDRLPPIPELIIKAIGGPAGEVQYLASDKDERLAIQAYVVPNSRQCVLLRAGYGSSPDQISATNTAWSDRLREASTEDVLRHCRRSYPSIICYDEDLWITVQRDQQANMALSPEEAEILRSANSLDPQVASLPLFINGRAGSGKSTLLQYLFAQCFLRWAEHLREQSQSRPLYFASSGELLKVAKDVVNRLLRGNHEHLLAEYNLSEADLTHLNSCFQDTGGFMLKMVGDDANERFPLSKHVTFAKFRRLWMSRFGRERRALREFGPQISWHVIRGLIKGMSVDELLGRDDYEELPEDERTVSKQVYETVFDRVWLAWYEPLCRQGDAWDGQDLVRFLIDEDRLPASHVAVFCDEAQDFTRLEIEALYRCSLFSDRMIDYDSVKRIPFVFAGDPFQTLNPTGFRWESVRAAFTERIQRSLYRFNSRTDVPSLPYRELTFNYRSSARIVHLCNSIQAVRAALFGYRTLKPQTTWQVEANTAAPVFFAKGDAYLEKAIREQPDLVLIVPCEEGEEVEFVAQDAYLRGLVQTDDDGTPRNVLSAARAKGLEFLRVALYGWSLRPEAAVLARQMKSTTRTDFTVDERLGLEYYLNNLYVAASRAQRRLFVIDDRESPENLWCFAFDEQRQSEVLRDLPDREEWQNNCGFLVQGVPESFAEDKDDSKTIAERFENEGLTKQDGYFLKQASQHYRIAGDDRKAYFCRAMAGLFEERYREAGQAFEKAAMLDKCIDALWRGEHYSDIVDCVSRQSELAKHPRCRIARFVQGATPTPRECVSLLDQLIEVASVSEDFRRDLRSDLWSSAIELAVRKKTITDKGVLPSTPAQPAAELADRLGALESYGTRIETEMMTRLLFAAGRYDQVLERIGRDDGSEIYREARTRQLVARLEGEGISLGRNDTQIVADFFFRQDEFEKASRYYGEIQNSGRLLECLRRTIRGNRVTAQTILERVVPVLVANGEWHNLVSLITEGQPVNPSWSKQERGSALELVHSTDLDHRVVIPALARSERLVEADTKAQHRVSEYLADRLVNKSSSVWRDKLSMHVAGAAVERAGKDLDALRYYEQWRDTTSVPREKTYAQQRWVVCKLRQADREDREGHTKKAANYREDASAVMEKLSWTEEHVSSGYPVLSDDGTGQRVPTREFAGTVSQQGKFEFLTFRVLTTKGWVNLESDDGLRARVHVQERRITSDDVSVQVGDGGELLCPEWGLRVRWIGDGKIQLGIGDKVFDLLVSKEA